MTCNISTFGFQVLFEDSQCLVVSKPSGLLTQAPPGIDCLEARIRLYLQNSRPDAGKLYLGVPHRLDRAASGIMVFGKTLHAARSLAQQFQSKVVKKQYWALVEGAFANDHGIWIDWLRKIEGQARSELVTHDHPQAKHAELHYSVLGRTQDYSWLEIILITGRTHQIRLQASSHGYPLLGDSLYGSTRDFGPMHDDYRLRSIALHARYLSFHHPQTQKQLNFDAPVPESWLTYLSKLKKEHDL